MKNRDELVFNLSAINQLFLGVDVNCATMLTPRISLIADAVPKPKSRETRRGAYPHLPQQKSCKICVTHQLRHSQYVWCFWYRQKTKEKLGEILIRAAHLLLLHLKLWGS